MDDLKILREAWERPDPPSPSTRARARAALMWRANQDDTKTSRRQLTHRPRRRLALGAALTATAAAAGFVFVQLASNPDATVPPPDTASEVPSGTALLPGQEILLAAAVTAQEQPATTGDYWYVNEKDTSDDFDGSHGMERQTETWYAGDGRVWIRNGCCADVYLDNEGMPGFTFARSWLTYEQLQDLPTDPEQLRARIKDMITSPLELEHPDGHTLTVEPPPAEAADEEVALALADLLYRVPAPPEVRATAFQAFALIPEVTSLGSVDGGEHLRITFDSPPVDKFADGEVPEGFGVVELVIDPDTSKVRSVETYQYTVQILAAEWTDQVPPTG